MKKINPMGIAAILFSCGMIIGAWGWDKNESTIEKRTHGAVTMMVIGGIMIVAGAIGFFTIKGDGK